MNASLHPPGLDAKPKSKVLSTLLRVLMGIIGTLMSMSSFPITAFAIFELINGTDNVGGSILVGGFFAIMAMASLPLLYFAFKRAPKGPVLSQEHERWILDVARKNDGVVTAPLLAVDSRSTRRPLASLRVLKLTWTISTDASASRTSRSTSNRPTPSRPSLTISRPTVPGPGGNDAPRSYERPARLS